MKRFAARLLLWIGISQILALLAAHFGAHPAIGVLLAGGLPLGAGGALTQQTMQGLATWDGGKFATQAVAASFVATPAQVCNGSTTYLILTAGGIGAGYNVTLPSAQAIVQQYKNAYGTLPTVGSTFGFELVNNGSGFTATLVAGAGVTITGTATVANNTTRLYLVTFTSAGDSLGNGATVTFQNINSKTN
jgi:hypothetical protein